MMFSLFLVAALRDAQLENMEFVRIQEEWVAETCLSRMDYCLPPEFIKLRSPKYNERQQAIRTIKAQGLAVFKHLAFASKHRDPNISIVANQLLENLYSCYECAGRTKCVFHFTQKEFESCKRCGVEGNCRLCNGTGDRRYVISGGQWEYRKNILPGR